MDFKPFYGQAAQDFFVLKLLNFKTNGFFLEIGTNDPIDINNTYLLEKKYNWSGLMVECEQIYEEKYIKERTSKYIIGDARTIDYLTFFKNNNFPLKMDYLQIDLHVSNGSTIHTLEHLNNTLMKLYTFNVVTFEHDIGYGNHYDTREKSRQIFKDNGYIPIFKDVSNGGIKYEDWYIHSPFDNMNFINDLKNKIIEKYNNLDISLEWIHIYNLISSI
jgi:hypothetical protein